MNRTKMISIKNLIGRFVREKGGDWPAFKGMSNKQIRKLARGMGISIKGNPLKV